MATESGHPSMSKHSEELFKSDCFNCSQEGKHVAAEVYCVECEDNLCMSCLNDHNKIARLRTHAIQRKPVVKDLNFLRLEQRNKIQRRHGDEMRFMEDTYKAIQKYLRDTLNRALVKNSDLNKELNLMKFLKERNNALEEETQNLRKAKDALQKDTEALKGQNDANMQRNKTLEEVTQNLRKDKDALQKENEAIKGQNDANMQRNKALEEETQNLRKDKDTLQNENEALKKQIDANMQMNKTLEEETQNLRKDKDDMQKENEALKKQNDANMQRNNALEEETKKLRKNTDALQKENDALKEQNDANMQRNTTLEEETQNLQKDKDALQKETEALKGQIDAYVQRSCPDMKDSKYSAVHVSDKNIRSSKNTDTCNKTGICSLDSGGLIIADFNNKCIKKLDKSFLVESQCDLSGYPYDVCQTSSAEVAVTMWADKKIQFVSAGQTMSLTRSFTTRGDGYCTGIACKDGKLYVCRNQDGSSSRVQVYDMSGSLLHIIQKDKSGSPIFYRPRHIANNARSSNIYVADRNNGFIILDKSGQLVDKITVPDLHGAWGVSLLPGDQLLVCGINSHNVIQFDSQGKNGRTLLTTADGLKEPQTLHFDPRTARLIIGMNDSDTIKVFSLVRK